MRRYRQPAHFVFCWFLLIAGTVLLTLASIKHPPRDWTPLLFFIPLTILAGGFTFQFAPRIYMTFGSIISLLCMLLCGPTAAAWTAWAGALFNELLTIRRGIRFAARSAGMYTLMWLAGGLVYQALGGTWPLTQLQLGDLARVLLPYVIVLVVNRVLMTLDRAILGLSVRESLFHITLRSLPIQISLAPVAALGAVVYTTAGLLPLVILLAFLMLGLAAIRWQAQTSLELEEQVKALDTLNRVGRTIGSSLQVQELIELIHEGASQLIDTSNFWIATYDQEREELVYQVLYDEGEQYPPDRRPYRPGEGLAAYIIEQKEPVLTHNLAEIKALPIRLTTVGSGRITESVLAVPMMVKGRVIGAIAAQSYQPDAFGRQEFETMMTLATQAAIALENARLFHEVEQGRRELGVVLESVEHALLVTDLAGRVRMANGAAERLFGVHRQDLIGHPLGETIQNEKLAALMERDNLERLTEPEELEIELSDGRYLVAHIAPVVNPGGERAGYVVVMADVTALYELTQLKSRVIRLVSHDLRTPLHLVGGFFEMLLKDLPPLSKEQADMAQRVQRNLKVMRNLLDDLIEQEARSPRQREPIDVKRLIREVVQEKRYHAEVKRQQMSADISPDLPPVMGIWTLLARVIANLLDNSIKYTSEYGEIRVRAWAEGDEVHITVQDNGIGIPPEIQPLVFDRFYRGRQRGTEGVSGIGMGLALVKEIVERHGGKVWVESEGVPGKGATFSLTLPAYREEGE